MLWPHILHSIWHHPFGNIFVKLQDGWTSYLNIHYHDFINESSLDDEFQGRALCMKICWFVKPRLALVSWWEKFGRHVPKLQALALRVLSHYYNSLMCEHNWRIEKNKSS
jgi:hypothetical protein